MPATISDACRSSLIWALTDGVGPILYSRIIERFGDAAAALQMPVAEFAAIRGIGDAKAGAIVAHRDEAAQKAEIELAAAAELGVRLLCREDAEYPTGLRQIPDAPIVLYIRGELRPTDHVALAIVGSRRCTIYGSEQARRFGELLAGAGFTIVSGLAHGIDAFAHHGAVDSGGRSLAVMGAGLSEIYPPDNRALAEKLMSNGAWISELPLRESVRASNFPARNRIIAGLSLGVLVVEAAARSGALITARLAGEYNREVFAIPGRVQEPMSLGTNALIRDGGAKLITCLEDILDGLGDVGATIRKSTAAHARETAAEPSLFDSSSAATAPNPALSDAEQRVLATITSEPELQDIVIQSAKLPVGEVLAALTALELKGLIRRVAGQRIALRSKS